jgi:hypothetical protein
MKRVSKQITCCLAILISVPAAQAVDTSTSAYQQQPPNRVTSAEPMLGTITDPNLPQQHFLVLAKPRRVVRHHASRRRVHRPSA